jgi:RNA polymerase sigma factor (sigma-70 family)
LTEAEKREEEHDNRNTQTTKKEKENPNENNTQREASEHREETKHRDNYFQRVVHIAEKEGRGRGLTVEEAQDCAMDFILRYLLAVSDADPNEAELSRRESGLIRKPEPWLIRCTRNAAINAYHKRERRHEARVQTEDIQLTVVIHTNASDPVFALLQQCEQEEIASLLENLEEGPRNVFMRCCLEGDSISEVATALGKTPNAIRLTLTRCRRRLAVIVGRSLQNTKKTIASLSPAEEGDEKA